MAAKMTSSRPYLIRALYEWILDNQLTPHILVNAEAPGVAVPPDYVRDGKIVLSLDPQAIRELQVDDEAVNFNARFSGVAMDITVPPQAVLAIYAKENGEGMMFPEETAELSESEAGDDNGEGGGPKDTPPSSPSKGPNLKVVK